MGHFGLARAFAARLAEALRVPLKDERVPDRYSTPARNDRWNRRFTTAMMLKDVDLVLDLAAERRLVLPFTTRLRELLDGAIEGGHADEDFMALYLALREAARESTGAGERR